MPWHALTVEVDAEAAEALGDALLERGALSVAVLEPDLPVCKLSVLLAIDADAPALLREALVATGLPARPHHLEAVADDDWVRRSQAQFPPIAIGERLWVAPSWHEPPAGSRAAVVRIDPGMAFGTGTHPSTRLVLEFLTEAVRGGERVLDYGCGSGILGIAAAKLGATMVDAVDIDPEAVATATANASLNAVPVRTGAPDALAPGDYHVVVANILAQPLMLLAPLLAARTAAAGRIALSGILESQAAEVAAAYEPFFATTWHRGTEGWSLVEGRRR
jgi:ribosomal protein L11 methyltransferase